MKLSVSEILENASKIKDKNERIEYMRNNWNVVLAWLLKYTFDDYEWLLPEGAPPYKESEFPDTHGMLYSEFKKMYLFIKGPDAPNIPNTKRESLYINLLETVHPNDAKLLIAVKDKKLPYKNITESFIREAYPDLLSQKKEKIKKEEQNTEIDKNANV